MKFQRLSPRQNLAMTWWNRPGFERYDGIICDGSIRSGKTVAMTVGFVMWAMARFNDQNFAICGKTIESLRRNVTSNLPKWLAGVFSFKEHRTENKIVVSAAGRSNSFYLFGGKDESSASLIQGITLAGILLDEVALMPESFVNQATGRCSVAGSKLWFNCNPEGPSHWFYKKWLEGDQPKKHNVLHLHFTMEDNYSLTQEIKDRYERQYSGVFYDRYIRGLWVVAEGLVYTMFNKDFHVVPVTPRPYDKYYISCDYGTANPTSMGLWGRANGTEYGSITTTAEKRAGNAPMRSITWSWRRWPGTCPSPASLWTPPPPLSLSASGGTGAFSLKRPPMRSWRASGTWPHGSNAGTCFLMPAAWTASVSLGFIGGTKRP